MTRIVKPRAERRDEILTAAHHLFVAEGYERVSVQAIIDAVGISKGAFYHHFPSKEALLQRLVADLVERGAAAVAAALADDGPPLEKLGRYFSLSFQGGREQLAIGLELMRTLYEPANMRLRHGLHEAARRHGAPVLARLLEEGHEAGAWRCPHPLWTAEAALHVGSLLNEFMASQLFEGGSEPRGLAARIAARANHTGDAIARLVGAPDGSVRFMTPDDVERVLAVARTLARRR